MALRRLGSVALAGALAITGCAGTSPRAARPVPVPAPGQGAGRVGPAVLIGAGTAATGPWRAWVFRAEDGSLCYEYEGGAGGGDTCGDEASIIEPSISATDREVYVSGGTRQQAAVGAVLRLSDGTVRQIPLVNPGALSTIGGRYFFVLLPINAGVERVEIVDAAGTILETTTLVTR